MVAIPEFYEKLRTHARRFEVEDLASSTYTGPLAQACGDRTLNFIGTKVGMTNSAVLTVRYIVTIGCTPVMVPSPGTYATAQTITLFALAFGFGDVACYTLDGSTPAVTTSGTCDAGSTTYDSPFTGPSGPFTLSSSATVKVLSTHAGWVNGALVSGIRDRDATKHRRAQSVS